MGIFRNTMDMNSQRIERAGKAFQEVSSWQRSNQEQLDKSVFYIAAGAIALVTTYGFAFFAEAPLYSRVLLGISTGLFIIVLCLSVASFLLANLSFNQQKKDIIRELTTGKKPRATKIKWLAESLLYMYGVLLILAVILAGVAVLLNFFRFPS